MTAYKFPNSLLAIESPSLINKVSAAFAYAQYHARFGFELAVSSIAKIALHECKFRTMEDAESFFGLGYISLYFSIFTKHFCVSLIELVFRDSSRSNWNTYQLCLNVFFHESESREP